MWRRNVCVGLAALAGGGIAAQLAFGGDGTASAIRMPALSRCVVHGLVRVTFAPAPGTTFSSLSVRVGADEVLQLASLAGPGSVRVTLPAGRSRVEASGTTSSGQYVQFGRSYRRCAAGQAPKPPKVARPLPTPYGAGGGTD
jgi:hypothetical protein